MCGYSNYRTSSGCGGGCSGNYNEFRSSSSCGGPVPSGCGGGC